MELLMICKISPNPSLLKRGRERELFVKEGSFPSSSASFPAGGRQREENGFSPLEKGR